MIFTGTVLIFIAIVALLNVDALVAATHKTERVVETASASLGGLGIVLVLFGAHF